MLKEDILNLIENFETETFKYNSADELYNDMNYIYMLEKEIKKTDVSGIKPIYDKLIAFIGLIKFKYGFESEIIKTYPELKDLKETVDKISLNDDDVINKCNYITTLYNNYINKKINMDFIKNNYENIQGQEGMYLALESLKSLIDNNQYRSLLDNNQVKDVLIDCIKLNNGKVSLKTIELKYKDIIKQIWKQSLSNEIKENENFRILFSNISGGNLRDKANLLMNRPDQASCSVISSNFIATYGSNTRKIGFIYPNNSEIITTSAYDLGSNVFGEGHTNKELGTTLSTPSVIEKIGIERAKQKGEDIYSSSCYNEFLVNSKPCGIVILGLGENDLNIDYEEAKMLSLEMNLPLYCIDTMKYKDNLSENDKYYIAYHSVLSFLKFNNPDILNRDDSFKQINEIINMNQDQIIEMFLTLKQNGKLNKENMCEMIHHIIDTSKINGKCK